MESERYRQLFGQRIQVFNFEFRVPITGVSQFGLLNLPFLPIELVTFADVGLAWDNFGDVDLRFDRTTTDRVPVFSTGISARANLLGLPDPGELLRLPIPAARQGLALGLHPGAGLVGGGGSRHVGLRRRRKGPAESAAGPEARRPEPAGRQKIERLMYLPGFSRMSSSSS